MTVVFCMHVNIQNTTLKPIADIFMMLRPDIIVVGVDTNKVSEALLQSNRRQTLRYNDTENEYKKIEI